MASYRLRGPTSKKIYRGQDSEVDFISKKSAQNEGDARRAIDLLRDAGEIANRAGDPMVTQDHVRSANDSVVKNRVLEIVGGMSVQKKLSLYAAALVAKENEGGSEPCGVRHLQNSL